MSVHAFIFELIGMLVALSLAILSGPISAGLVSFFYGSKNRRVRR
jgi:hypothetical protein